MGRAAFELPRPGPALPAGTNGSRTATPTGARREGSPRPSFPAYLSGVPAAGTATGSRARCPGGSQPAGRQRALRGAAPGARWGPAAPIPPPGTHVPLKDAPGQDGAGPHHDVSADGEAAGAVALNEHDAGGLRLQHHHSRPLVHLIIRRREPVTPARRSAGTGSSWDTWGPRTLPRDPTAPYSHRPRSQGSRGASCRCRYLPATRPATGTSRRSAASAAMAATLPEQPSGPAPAATAPRRPEPGQRHQGRGVGPGLPGTFRGPPARGS